MLQEKETRTLFLDGVAVAAPVTDQGFLCTDEPVACGLYARALTLR